MNDRPTYDPDRSLGYMSNLVARQFKQSLDRRIQPLGLSAGVFPVLLQLWRLDGQFQSELLKAIKVEQPTLANTLSRMERDGLVRREADSEDRRRSRVFLTDRARAIEVEAVTEAKAINQRASQALTAEEHDTLLALLGKVSQAFSEAG
jgi:DNA-binding MarR family transcriptional regulator